MKHPWKIRDFGPYEPILIFAVGVALLIPCIWAETSVTGQDEYWLSLRTPMETLERDSWLTTWVNGEPRLRKPPLLYWAIMLTYKILGVNLFAARIWGVVSGAGLAMCACLFHRVLFKTSGMLAGLIGLATVAVAVEGRMAILDLPVSFLTCIAVYFSVKWGQTARMGWISLSAFCLGLSFLLKGPIGFVFFSTSALAALFVFRKWHFVLLHWSHVVMAMVILLAVCVPWPAAMAYLWPNFLGIVDEEIAARQFGDIHLGSPFSTLGGAIALVFPWSVVLVFAGASALSHARDSGEARNLWLVVWFLLSIAPFFLIKTYGRYMTPVIPAACVLCANWFIGAKGALKSVVLVVTVSLIACVVVVFCLFFIWFGRGVPVAIVCLVLMGLLFWITFATYDARIVAGTIAVLLTMVLGGLYPTLGINAMPENLESIVGGHPVASYNGSQPSMLSIRVKRSAVQLIGGVERFNRRLQQFDGYVFMREKDAEGFEVLVGKLGVHFMHAGQFKTFFSRQAWIRFAREGATMDNWKDAIRSRSLSDLRSTIYYYRVYPTGHTN
jgi:4-amino-4-deoxy-L-arabinose transferase-like glycosyltransferase